MIKQLPLSELFANKVGSLNPLNFETEEFELYSIPAYETGIPEKLLGREIGSSKKKLKGGDVLLSRIVPHIRRCWIVPEKNDLRQIGSGEWIVFRSNDIDSSYLRHYLMSDVFHSKFMNTVKGVGGSLLRADPKLTGKLKIPLPPLATQKKIAAILDAADAHRQKTKQLLAKYDELAQSIFLEMFGDPVTNPKGWEVKRLEKVCDKITDGTHHSPEPTTEGAPYVTAKHVKPFKLSFSSKPTYISWQDHQGIYKRCSPKKGDVLYIKDGATTGIACINTFEEEISLLSSLALIQTNRELLNPDYLCFWLNYEKMKDQLLSIWMSGAAIQRYTLKKIKSFEIMVPPIEMQERFSLIINANEKIKSVMNKEAIESENLFNSLLQKAFKGELVK